MAKFVLSPEQLAAWAKHLGVTEEEVLQSQRREMKLHAEERRRWKNLQAAARRRALSLHMFTAQDDDDEHEYGLFSIYYGGEPMMFEDLTDVIAELKSRPIEK